MFVAAFLAGSFFPFSSELVMLGLLEAGADATSLLVWGTIGNTLGGLFNYGVGSMGKEEWVTRRLKISPERLQTREDSRPWARSAPREGTSRRK